jgi:RNA polymerase sigma-70 factor (ECF subfamily)
MDEQEALSRSKAGELDSFNWLVERYQVQVYNLALHMLGNRQDADDAAQDAFISAFKAIKGFRGGNFRVWLLRITANTCRDRLRTRRRRATVPLDSLHLQLETTAESPEDYALRQELGRLLARGLASLPGEQRLVVTLVDIRGLSYEEVSRVIGSPLGTVRSRLSRGRAHLRDFLLQHRELLPPGFRLYE